MVGSDELLALYFSIFLRFTVVLVLSEYLRDYMSVQGTVCFLVNATA